MKGEVEKAVLQSLSIEQKGIGDMANLINLQAIEKVISILSTADRIITCASGSSGFAAMKLAHTLCCIERPAKFMSPAEAIHGGLGFVKKGDPVIIVSRGGKTTELLPIIDVCCKKGAFIIGVTENQSSHLAQSSDVVLPLVVEKESDPLNLMASTSFVATIALFDAIIAGIMVDCEYENKHFALIHPGGAVGQMLNR
ncbi:MAG: SIS domain-containing protein [Halobacteriota archaeon]